VGNRRETESFRLSNRTALARLQPQTGAAPTLCWKPRLRSPALVERKSGVRCIFNKLARFSEALFENLMPDAIVLVDPTQTWNTQSAASPAAMGSYLPAPRRALALRGPGLLREAFVSEGLLSVEASIANFEKIVARIREQSSAPILVYNVSAVVPGERMHAYSDTEETVSTRIRRFNLGLMISRAGRGSRSSMLMRSWRGPGRTA